MKCWAKCRILMGGERRSGRGLADRMGIGEEWFGDLMPGMDTDGRPVTAAYILAGRCVH